MPKMQLFDPAISDEDLRKALDLSSGADLIQNEIDKAIAEALTADWPLYSNMPRKGGTGDTYLSNQRTARGTGAWVNDTEEPSDSNSTYQQDSWAYKTPLYRGKVTRKLQAAGKAYADALQEEVEAGLDVVRDMVDNGMINGSVSGNAKQFDGLVTLVADPAMTVNAGSSTLTLAMLDAMIDLVKGEPTMIICSKRGRREINALLQAQQRYVDTIEVNGGFKVISYNGIPIFIAENILDNEGTGTNETRIFCLNTTKDVFLAELTPLKMEALAKVSSQYDSFDIYADIVLVVKQALAASQIKKIIPPTP